MAMRLWDATAGARPARLGAGTAEVGQSAGPGSGFSLRSGREECAFEDAGLSVRGHGHGEGMDESIS